MEHVNSEANHTLDNLGIAKNAREEKMRAREDKLKADAENARWPSSIASTCSAKSRSRAGSFNVARAVAACFGAPADERGILPASPLSQRKRLMCATISASRKTHADQAAEQRVELRHSHRCRHALSRDIAQHKVELSIRRVQVAIVAAHRS
jgi:hypothetical protein